jgi:hypothetical protein
MNRRHLLATGAALAAAPALAGADAGAFLGATRHVDCDHAAIRQLAARLTAGQPGDRDPGDRNPGDPDKARAIFTYVSREIRFGFAAGFWDMPASAVLRAGVGYCNTKSTLFTALLRAAGIPARQRFMDIETAVLAGLIDPGTPYVDHSTTEVWLNGGWVETDAYIVDPPLLAAAQRRLALEGGRFGYGAHHRGVADWDAATPAFSQYNRLVGERLGTREWGVFADVGDFYARTEAPWNRLNALLRGGFGVIAASANRRADALRTAAAN